MPGYEPAGAAPVALPPRAGGAQAARVEAQAGDRHPGVAPVRVDRDPAAGARQRQRDLAARLKRDTFQDLCEIVRDLSAYGRAAPLNAEDAAGLQKSRRWLCQEWAAAAGIPFEGATAEVDRLLEAGRRLSPTPTARSK